MISAARSNHPGDLQASRQSSNKMKRAQARFVADAQG
jgi:hypothetical protein